VFGRLPTEDDRSDKSSRMDVNAGWTVFVSNVEILLSVV